VPLLLNTALCKLKRGAWAEAALDCTEVGRNPHLNDESTGVDPNPCMHLAHTLLADSEDVPALPQVLDLQPKNAKALFRRGKARIEMGEWPDAERDLKKAQQCDRTVRAEVAAQLRELAKRITAQDKKDMAEMGVRPLSCRHPPPPQLLNHARAWDDAGMSSSTQTQRSRRGE
jgi:hypothetical protein